MSEQFPLGETSTIYMSGEQLYSIIQHNKPGYKNQVILLPEKAQEVRDVVNAALEEAEQRGAEKAWDEGWNAGYFDYVEMIGNDDYQPQNNPYRTDQTEGTDG